MKKYILSISVLVIGISIFLGIPKTQANPNVFNPPVSTTSTSTSPTYMTSGTATTSITYDSFYPDTLGNYTKTNSATLITQFAGSSTQSVLGIDVEYSHDGSNWYRDNLTALTMASTSVVTSIGVSNRALWTFASSTTGGGAVTAITGATSTKAINIITPIRYTRIIYSMSGDRGAIWGQLIPNREKS